MRTTLVIDDDVLAAAKELASAGRKSIGEVLSSLARKALQPTHPGGGVRNGVPLLVVSPNAGQVTSELVKRLSEELD